MFQAFCTYTRLNQNLSKIFRQGGNANKSAFACETVPDFVEVVPGNGRSATAQYGKENKLSHFSLFALMKCNHFTSKQKNIMAEVVASIPIFRSFETQTIVDEKFFFYFYQKFCELDYELLKSSLNRYSNVILIIYTVERMLLFRRNRGVWDAFDLGSHISVSSNCVLPDHFARSTSDGLAATSSSMISLIIAEMTNYARILPMHQAQLVPPRSRYGFRSNGNNFLCVPRRSYSSIVKVIPTIVIREGSKIHLSAKSYQTSSKLLTRLYICLRKFQQKFSNTSDPVLLEFQFICRNEPTASQLSVLLPFFCDCSAGPVRIMMKVEPKKKVKDGSRNGLIRRRIKVFNGKISVFRDININAATYVKDPRAIFSSLGSQYRELSEEGIQHMVVKVSGRPNAAQKLALWDFIKTYSNGENMAIILQMAK